MSDGASLQARLLIMAIRMLRVKRTFAPDRLETTIAENRRKGPAQPVFTRRLKAISTTWGGRTIHTVAPRGWTGGRRLLYLHGGGFVLSIQDPHWGFIGKLAERLDAAVTVPLYPLAPEHSLEVMHAWLLGFYRALDDQGALTLVGDSAGATLALTLAMQARDLGLPQPERLVLLSPALDFSFSDPAQPAIDRVDPILNLAGMANLLATFAPGLDPHDPVVSPLFGDLTGLAPMALFAGGLDLTYPDAARFQSRLAAQGSNLALFDYPAMPHVWPLFPLPEAEQALDETVAFIENRPNA